MERWFVPNSTRTISLLSSCGTHFVLLLVVVISKTKTPILQKTADIAGYCFCIRHAIFSFSEETASKTNSGRTRN